MKTIRNLTTALACIAGLAGLTACTSSTSATAETGSDTTIVSTENLPENQATAIFAMGCFWCAESDFEKVDGVVDVVSGYTGGKLKNPTYEQVTYDETGHYEAILVTYDKTKLSYDDLLKVFWRNVDPFDARGQFCDKGTSYLSAVFPGNDEEAKAAEASKERWEEHFGREIVTAVVDRADFYAAEEYHQDYYSKNPVRYSYYRNGCRRDARLKAVWGAAK